MKTVPLLVKLDVPETMAPEEAASVLDAFIVAGMKQAAATPESRKREQERGLEPLVVKHHFPETIPQPHPGRFANLPEEDE